MENVPPFGKCASSKKASKEALKYALQVSESRINELTGSETRHRTPEERIESLESGFIALFSIMGVTGLFAIATKDYEPEKKPKRKRKAES